MWKSKSRTNFQKLDTLFPSFFSAQKQLLNNTTQLFTNSKRENGMKICDFESMCRCFSGLITLHESSSEVGNSVWLAGRIEKNFGLCGQVKYHKTISQV